MKPLSRSNNENVIYAGRENSQMGICLHSFLVFIDFGSIIHENSISYQTAVIDCNMYSISGWDTVQKK